MQLKKFLVCSLALISLFAFGCAKKNDTSLGEAKLNIPIYTINAPAKGKILGLILEKGEHIGKDQPLFAIANDDVDAKAKSTAEDLAKAEAELKRLEIGSTAMLSDSEIAAAKQAVDNAQAKANKMNSLLAQGAVSKRQAQTAEAELATARASYLAVSGQSAKLKASPEAIAKQKETVEALRSVNKKALEEQNAYESLAPNSCIVTEKLAKSGDEVEKDQPVLKLLAQDECELTFKISAKAKEKLTNKQITLVFKEKGSDLVFTGKLVKLDGDMLTALVKLPTGIKQGTNVEVFLQE
ncbi:MAG: HlyD family efflux transporter periplasmic adaptor subunit [Phascolarctobacterium sp.]|nr:HlyD family efflux transporter periplasmic adaptor subunit [Phascolarctobacterium sp.]